jgi:hypothetical protein
MTYNRVIACFWTIAAVWLGWGATADACRDRFQGFRTNGWVIALSLIVCVFTICAGCAALIGRKWAIRSLLIVASLVLADTVLCLMMDDCSFEWRTIPVIALPVLTFISPLVLKQMDQVA